jgi:hypothetical protein
MAYTKYSLTPANNNAAPPDGAPEGMLPSAVNDTMRDMMAQIRDVGDGIRGGTYTMTAPVITGGSINGTTIGATTASTGAFSTLSATGVTTVQAGTVSLPAITTTGDTNTGIFFPAADTIAFTEGGVEAMRINSSANVGIGTSSPTKRLTVVNLTDTTTVGNNSVMTIQGGAGGTVNSVAEIGFAFQTFSGTNPLCALGYQLTSNAGSGSGALTFSTRSVTTDTAPSERMRITSAGDVGIGTSSPIQKLDVTNGGIALTEVYALRWYGSGSTLRGSVAADSGSNLYFGTGSSNTERMRIDSSGNLLVGTTSKSFGAVGSNQLMVKSGSADSLTVWNTGSGGAVGLWRLDTVGAGFLHIFTIGTDTVGTITTNGSTTSYNTSSDYRLKENVAPMQNALSVVQQLKPVTYTWKANGSNGQGFIAHELQEVCPDAVNGKKDAVNADGSIKPQGIDTSFLVATLTAAIQEQQTLINNLTTRLNALEGK